ncbi:MAG: cobyric acid synthase [Acidobacteriota bacterium]
MARAIFVGGTASNAGKSWFATALCRWFARQGVRVAPFKAQNMSNNSFPLAGGGEIGRAQVAQAEACGLAPEAAMNPVLLKPCGDSRSQVIVHGKVWRTVDAMDYYKHSAELRQESLRAYVDLAWRFDVIVIEGAGSVAEVNLRGREFTNLSLARDVDARCVLVADIERGGVFASVLGTLDLLPPEDRARFVCFAVNQFRGDRRLFDEGVAFLEERSGIPCLGVFPHAPEIHLDAEDSLAGLHGAGNSRVAIVRFPRVSNTTDFRLLPDAAWIDCPDARAFDVVILPGTKSTLADLEWLRETGLAEWVIAQHESGAQVLGICGGYQMLGETISDPDGADGVAGRVRGLGLLPVDTAMQAEKTTQVRRARTPAGAEFDAYEIHMGHTSSRRELPPFALLEDGTQDGVVHGRVSGTYLHGALESAAVLREFFGIVAQGADKQRHYDALADWLVASASPGILGKL